MPQDKKLRHRPFAMIVSLANELYLEPIPAQVSDHQAVLTEFPADIMVIE